MMGRSNGVKTSRRQDILGKTWNLSVCIGLGLTTRSSLGRLDRDITIRLVLDHPLFARLLPHIVSPSVEADCRKRDMSTRRGEVNRLVIC